MKKIDNENHEDSNISDDNNEQGKKNIMYYSSLIKKFMNINISDEDYLKQIKNKPDFLFKLMDEKKLKEWEKYLFSFDSPSETLTDNEIFLTSLSRNDQKVINNDTKRTRVREGVLVPGFGKILESMLTYYCDYKKIFYKQGINEIFGPFLLLKYKFKNLTYTRFYELGEKFIDLFLPNYFYEKDLYSLKSSLGLFMVLLKYHEPSVYNKLDTLDILPEMYATNAITTLMSGKLKLDLLYEYWDRIIKSQDPLIMHFILVALYIHHREIIIHCDNSYLASLASSLTITSLEELNTVYNMALKLRERTPYSYRIFVNKIGFLKKNNKYIKEAYEKYQPQSLPAMPIFPLEIIQMTDKDIIECIDPNCKYCKKNEDFVLFEKIDNNIEDDEVDDKINIIKTDDKLTFKEKIINDHICEKCEMKIKKEMENILLDLRILNSDEDEDDEKTGILTKMIRVDQDELKSEDFSKIISNRFLGERGLYHFVFLTSTTDNFVDFESKYYKDNLTELDKKKMMFGLIEQRKINKKLSLDDAQNNLTWRDVYLLKEYDNFRNTLLIMQQNNFPYVGYVYGGFNSVHEESLKLNYELLMHEEKYCYICKEKNIKKGNEQNILRKKSKKKIKDIISDSLWEHKKKIRYDEISEVYKGKNISTFFSLLLKCKNKTYYNDDSKSLILIINVDDLLIEIYEFLKTKIYSDTGREKEIIEQKRKNTKYYDLGKEKEKDQKEFDLILLEELPIDKNLIFEMNKIEQNIIGFKFKDIIKTKEKKANSFLDTYTIIVNFPLADDSKSFYKLLQKCVKDSKKKKKMNK